MSRPPIERIRLADALPEPISHYTDAVRAGDTVWVSGLLAVDRDGALVGGADVVAQAEQVFRNLAVVLERVGARFSDIVKVVVYLIRIEDRAPLNEVRRRHFGPARPASTLVEVSRLAHPEALVEIEAVVYAPEDRGLSEHDRGQPGAARLVVEADGHQRRLLDDPQSVGEAPA